MKKLILLFVLMTIGLSSCEQSESERAKDIKKIIETTFYYRDSQTGLCFAGVYSRNAYGDVVSITCVPCDSLKKIGIK
jgi:hypothetical protein